LAVAAAVSTATASRVLELIYSSGSDGLFTAMSSRREAVAISRSLNAEQPDKPAGDGGELPVPPSRKRGSISKPLKILDR
jgi:hypothetical protein